MPTPWTVDGRELAPDYDVVLAHEHLFIDLTCWLDTSDASHETLRDAQVGPETISSIRKNPFACRDNLLLDDETQILAELERLGGHRALIVDVTPDFIGRRPARLARVSRAAGVDIVTGCGSYIEAAWPAELHGWTIDDFAGHILRRFCDPRPAAVIGEIGTSAPITPAERRSLTGAARAQRRLGGVPMYVHLDPWRPQGHAALDIVEAAGGDLSTTVLCHLDVSVSSGLDLVRSVLARGCVIAFDVWGDEDEYGGAGMPTDLERATATAALIADGYGNRLVHSQDICTKSQLAAFGGPGFAHIPDHLPGLLSAAGVPPDDVRAQLAGNALALLAGRVGSACS